jgi:hypothetical protein
MNVSQHIKLAVWAGIIGPLLLGGVITALTIFERDFMLSIGWKFNAPLDWPSGLALGPLGWMMMSTFFLSGLLMMLFVSGLRLSLPYSSVTRVSIWLLVAAGFGMIGLASLTDKTIRTTPDTWHGHLHDASFALIGFTLMTAMVLLGFVFLQDVRWKNLAIYTWITVVLAVPTFWTKGVAFYFFLAAILIWCEVIALRLRSVILH